MKKNYAATHQKPWKNNKKWFTLIELLLVMFIIGIWILWASNLNFNSLNEKQKIDIFSNKIIVAFEEIRNNALLWKWIGTSLDIPEKWKIEISSSWTWGISTHYNNGSWITYENIDIETNYQVEDVTCSSIDNSFTWSTSWIWIIEIERDNLTLTWACDNINYKKMRVTLSLNNEFRKTLEINTVNWLIESF
jgi:prepilin-type N-terminal cleavage/methylation domain-containing protein